MEGTVSVPGNRTGQEFNPVVDYPVGVHIAK
jgi:hypothetical protein